MPKRYFVKKSKQEPKLHFIIAGVAFALVLVLLFPNVIKHTWNSLPTKGSQTVENAEELIAKAESLIQQGALTEAQQALKPLINVKDPIVSPRAIMLQANLENKRGKKEEALKLLSDACITFKASPLYPMLSGRRGQQLELLGNVEEARQEFESIRDNAPPAFKSIGLLGLGRLKEKEGDLITARDLYRESVENAEWGSPVWDEAVEELGRLNVHLIFSPIKTPESKYYTVEKGDSLMSIGVKLNTTQGLLMRANGITDASRLSLGQRLKFTPKDFKIIIERSSCTIFLMDNRGIFKRYKVGLGKPGHETTLGSYVIGTKQKDPVWFKPGVGPIEPGAPENELGSRWMPLEPVNEGLPKDLGIHGTIAPETVGYYSSKGCARMHNHDVEELYDLVVRGTPVDIVETYQPENREKTG